MKLLFVAFAALILFSPGAVPAVDGVADAPEDVRPLLIGSGIPEGLSPKTGEGQPFDLEGALKNRPTLLIIYRGGW